MSNFKLGIFNDLAGYLTAAYTECGASVDKCDDDKAYNRYYLQKYYKPKSHTLRNEDVAPQFTNAVVKFAKALGTFDKSVGSSPTLKKLLRDEAQKHLEKLTVNNSGNTIGDLVNDLNALLLKKTAANGTNAIQNAELNNVGALIADLSAVIDRSGLLSDDADNAKKCLDGTGKKLKSGTCSSLKTDLEKPLATPQKYTLAGSDLSDPAEVRKQVRQVVVEEVLSKIDAWIAANYDTTGLTIAGDKTNVAAALTALKNGKTADGKSLDETELHLFNDFFTVMKKNTDGWAECRIDEIDLSKLADFRINANMIGTLGGRVPSIVALIPKLTPNTKIGYNNGSVSIPAAEDTLKKVFQDAYLNSSVPMLPGFDDKANSELRPDLESMLSEILTRKTTPDAHIGDDETSKIAKVLNKWRRVGEDVWEHTLDDGVTTVTIKPGSAEFEAEVSREVTNCAAVGFSKDPVNCAAFLRSVALENTDELAVVALQLNEDVAAEVVANLHPKFALAILKAFGFHRKMCKDRVAGRQIEKIQRASEWVEKFVDKKFTDSKTANAIKSQPKLINFLDLLAQLVNANPSVLNDNMVTETEESRGETIVPNDLVARKIKAAKSKNSGKPVLGWGEIQSNMNKIYGSFSRGLTFDGSSTNSPFGMDNLFPQMSMLTAAPVVRGSTWGGMAGGGSNVKVFLQDHQTALEYSRNVQIIIDELLANLKSSGKTFDKSELDAISMKKTQFEAMERELFDIAWNIQRYSQLLKVVETENRPEIITFKHVEKYVEKYNSLLNRYEKTGNSFNTLISLLKDCAEDKENGDECKTL